MRSDDKAERRWVSTPGPNLHRPFNLDMVFLARRRRPKCHCRLPCPSRHHRYPPNGDDNETSKTGESINKLPVRGQLRRRHSHGVTSDNAYAASKPACPSPASLSPHMSIFSHMSIIFAISSPRQRTVFHLSFVFSSHASEEKEVAPAGSTWDSHWGGFHMGDWHHWIGRSSSPAHKPHSKL